MHDEGTPHLNSCCVSCVNIIVRQHGLQGTAPITQTTPSKTRVQALRPVGRIEAHMNVGLMNLGLQYATQQRLTASCSKVSYAHAGGVSGCKRQRLCPPLQAKSRRRSTQGIVSHEVPAEPQVSNGSPKLDWVRCAGAYHR